MGIFDPKVIKWHKALMDAICKCDEVKTLSYLEHPEFKSLIDFKTGNLVDAVAQIISLHHHWTDPGRYARTDIGLYVAERADLYFGKNIFEKFFVTEATDNAKASYLRAVVDSRDTGFVQYFIDHGAPLDHGSKIEGQTALHIAASKGRTEVIECLIKAGADPRIKDKKMNTAADYAEAEKHHGLATYLRQEMAKFSAKTAKAEEDAGDWRLTSKHEISCISEKPQIGYRITGIFNFESGTYTQISTNTASGQESHSITPIEALRTTQLVDQARQMLKQKGGEMPDKKMPIKTGVISQ